MKTTIIICVSVETDKPYELEITDAKFALRDYFGTRLTDKESMDSPLPVLTVNTELNEMDKEWMNTNFPSTGLTKLLVLCHTKEQICDDIIYVTN